MTSTNYKKNRLFAKYGHVCEMANELDELPKFVPGNSYLARMRRALLRVRTVSETNKRGNRFLRSQGAIANEKHRHLKNYRSIIHPFSDIRNWWELFICAVFLVQFIMIPLDVAYYCIPTIVLYRSLPWKWLRMTFDCLCFVDVCLNFVTGYYNPQKKQAVLAPSKIAFHYISTYFIPDFLSSLPTHIDLFLPIRRHSVLFMTMQLLSVLKMLRLRTFIKYCNDFAEAFEIPYSVYRIMMVLIASFIYFHLVTCSLIFTHAFHMGYFLKKEKNKDLIKIPEKGVIRSASYSEAFYAAIIIISNAGYGQSEPVTTAEILLVVVIWLVSRLLLVFLIGRIMQVIKATTSASHKYIEMVRQLREYMRYKQLPEYMQRRLLTFYEFRYQKSYFRESEILSTISGQLRQEIVMHSCRKLVENVAFFKNLPLTLLVRIVSCLRSEVFLINDVIVRATTPGNSMFFIASGTVAVFTSSGREICHLEDGAHFGEIALVMRDELRVASVVAVEVCELYRLDRKEFVRAIHPYPDLLDNIQRIAADRMERTTMLDEHNRREMASRRLY